MKAYKVTVLVVDQDQIGDQNIKDAILYGLNSERCITPDVIKIENQEIGEWNDDHPLNKRDKAKDEFERLFTKTCEWQPDSREIFALHYEAYLTSCGNVVLFDRGNEHKNIVMNFCFCPYCGAQMDFKESKQYDTTNSNPTP